MMKFDVNVTKWFNADFVIDKFNAEVKQNLDNNLLPKCLGIHHEARSYFVDEYECKFLVCNNGDVFSNKDNPFIKKFLRTKKLERICND